MFGLFRLNKVPRGEALLTGTTDIHCHLLPGVDDGMDSVRNSLALLAKEEIAGIRRIYFTPHSMGQESSAVDKNSYGSQRHSGSNPHRRGSFENPAVADDFSSRFGGILPDENTIAVMQRKYDDFDNGTDGRFAEEPPGGFSNAHLKGRFELFKSLYKGKIDIRLAAEYMMNKSLLDKIRSHDLLTYSDGSHVLVETSYLAPPMDMDGILYEMGIEGFKPVLAHPERYEYMGSDHYRMLYERGVEFQLNYLSLTGYYGRHVYEKAVRLLENGWYTYAGSDLHRLSTFYNAVSRLKLDKKHAAALASLFDNNASL